MADEGVVTIKTASGAVIEIVPLDEVDVGLADLARFPTRPGDEDPRLAAWQQLPLRGTPPEQAAFLASTYGAACHLCGQPIDMALKHTHPASVQVDHLVPRSKGGTETWGNVALSHKTCNSSKGDERRGARPHAFFAQKLSDAVFTRTQSVGFPVGWTAVPDREVVDSSDFLRRVKQARRRLVKEMGEDGYLLAVRVAEETVIKKQQAAAKEWARARYALQERINDGTFTTQADFEAELSALRAVLVRFQEHRAAWIADGEAPEYIAGTHLGRNVDAAEHGVEALLAHRTVEEFIAFVEEESALRA